MLLPVVGLLNQKARSGITPGRDTRRSQEPHNLARLVRGRLGEGAKGPARSREPVPAPRACDARLLARPSIKSVFMAAWECCGKEFPLTDQAGGQGLLRLAGWTAGLKGAAHVEDAVVDGMNEQVGAPSSAQLSRTYSICR